METLRIDELMDRQRKLESELKKDTSFEGIRYYEAIRGFNEEWFKKLEIEKIKNLEKLIHMETEMSRLEKTNPTADKINKYISKLNQDSLEIYKKILIPKLSNDGLQEQINLFESDYRRCPDFTQLTILILLKKEMLRRKQIEIDRM